MKREIKAHLLIMDLFLSYISSIKFERILYYRLYSYLQNSELLTGHQFGFRPTEQCPWLWEVYY